MIAAKGRLPDRAPQDMLDGAKMRPTTINANVEATTVKKLFASGSENIFLSCCVMVLVDDVAVFISFLKE